MLVDSHCHLDPAYLPQGPGDVLTRAKAAGVGAFVCIGVGRDLAAARAAVALAAARKDVFATVGVHPHDAASTDEKGFDEIARLAREPRDVQKNVFRRMIALARELEKPIVIHTRSAPADTLAILEEESARDVGGIIHCFSEDRAFAERTLRLDFDLSFSGILTFKNAHGIREAARFAPADRILVETDSPFLAPVPLRGKTCEPAYIVHTVGCLAELRGQTFDVIAQQTTANAAKRLGVALLSD